MTIDQQSLEELMRFGELTIVGKLVGSSNSALLATVEADDSAVECVYKPIRGERPLWDFPDGTLAEREVAAYIISETAQWHCVPVTVLRDGPVGPGMVQQWIHGATSDTAASIFTDGTVPDGWISVATFVQEDDTQFVLAHRDSPSLATLAGFDLVVNNADRKGAHIIPTGVDDVFGVDHGLTFHQESKLRTVLWGWAGDELPANVVSGTAQLLSALGKYLDGDLAQQLGQLVSPSELAALNHRMQSILADPVFPLPPHRGTAIPWPPL